MSYVVGQWVRGPAFYGRSNAVAALLEGGRRRSWLVGRRRIGKTSLLRQIEHLTADGARGLAPIYWDLQGAADARELVLSLDDAVLDAGGRLDAWRPPGAGVPHDRPGACLLALLDAARAQGGEPLLLIDETEEVAAAAASDPDAVRELASSLAASACRIVATSSVRLLALADEDSATAAFVAVLGDPLPLGPLADDEACSLLRQTQLPAANRPELPPEDLTTIQHACAGHPFLLQLVAKRTVELGDPHRACAQVVGDRMLDALFRNDLALLPERHRDLLLNCARAPGHDASANATGWPVEASGRLLQLGFLRRGSGGRLRPAGRLLEQWLAGEVEVRG